MNKEYFHIAHNNLRDTIKNRINSINGAKLFETDDFLLFTIGIPADDGHLNGCLSFNDNAYKNTYIEAIKFFKDLGYDFSFWIRKDIDKNLEKLLIDKKYEPKRRPGSSVMVTEKRIENAPLPSGYELKEVNSLNYLEDFKSVIKESFEKDDKTIDIMFSSKENLFSEKVKSFIIYNQNKNPVSAAITSFSSDSAGIYYVGTLKEERSKGIGKAITKVSTNIGFDQGKNIVVLQASILGEYVYEKLGYKKVGEYLSYGIKINLSI